MSSLDKKTKFKLHQQFSSEEKVGITYYTEENAYVGEGNEGLEDEIAYLPSPFGHMGLCTNCARFIQSELGHDKVEIYGFPVENNPVTSDEIMGCGGHDFALVENRYIVDIWISLYAGEEKQIVFDIQDPDDAVKIKHYFGDPQKWSWMNQDERFVEFDDKNFPEDKRIKESAPEKDISMAL